ncbi:MAG: hypothetical protein ACOYN6_03170 [Ignavibacteria bacterium]
MKKINFIFAVLSLMMFVLFSCNSENPIVHSNEPIVVDSNLFVWRLDTFFVHPYKYFYIADTNNVYIAGTPASVHINNGLIQYINHNDNDFYANCLTGTSKNNVFIGGGSLSSSISKLKHWNGFNIVDIVMPYDSSNRIVRIEPVSDNDIWMSTASNTIYHYKNNIVTTYKLDSSLNYGVIYNDGSGNLFTKFDSYIPGTFNSIFSIYKYENDNWVKVYKDSVTTNSEMDYCIGFGDNKLLRTGKNGIYYFNGNGFLPYLPLSSIFTVLLAGANAQDNVLFLAEENNFSTYIFYFDGKRIFRTPNQYLPSLPNEEIQFKYGRFYFLIDMADNKNYFGTAKLKRI